MQNGDSRYDDSDDDEELKCPTGSFEKLDSSLHYSLTQHGTEIIPTDYVLANHNLSKSMVIYGGPTSSISTLHVIGRRVNKKHHQYDLSAGMILGVREVVGGIQSLYDEEEESDENDYDETGDDGASSNEDDDSNDNDDDGEDDEEETEDPDNKNDNAEVIDSQGTDTKSSLRTEADKDITNRDPTSHSPNRVNLSRLREQCNHFEKYKFPAGSYIISGAKALPHRYKFKAYAPRVFSKIRNFFGVGKQDFLHSICGKGAFIEFMSNAKSGQVLLHYFLFLLVLVNYNSSWTHLPTNHFIFCLSCFSFSFTVTMEDT